ncbi:MAG: hypothetical protein HYV35_05470 [Lentisphaerae bacterium]|nr:hypothetical protein [Lentisphaerota bacterium]
MPANEPKPTGEIILYRSEDGNTCIECRFANENIWLSQAIMAELFQTTVPNINLHIKNILAEGELAEGATIKDYLIVRQEGGRQVQRPLKYYNLEMILADKLAEGEYDHFQARRLAAETGADAKAFDEAVKKLPGRKPYKKA